MGRIRCSASSLAYAAGVLVAVWRTPGHAIPLDADGDIKFGMRTYVNARVGTETTHDGFPGSEMTLLSNGTFPHSDAGHLRQNRLFIEADLKHDLTRLLREGVGPLSLLNDLPFKFKNLGYEVTFRGEGDGLYDWGGEEYSTAKDFYKLQNASKPLFVITNQQQAFINVGSARQRLRHLGTDRERLFQAFVEASAGDLFVRIGRQNLSWGETDGFQLLDHINPLDSSFGGFLISLDERRVPLDMARAQYFFGEVGPLSEIFLEGYVAIDNKVGYTPGTPAGSPWSPPGLGAPSNATKAIQLDPARTVNNARGGGRLVFNAFDATFSVAHYYTYFDLPALQLFTNRSLLNAFDDGQPCPIFTQGVASGQNFNNLHCGAPTHTVLTAPKVQVSGATTTFAVPQLYSVVRSEFAYFKDEPAYTQGQLDPFIFNPLARTPESRQTNGRRLRDSINAVLGIDMNQWIRVLNPNQTFLMSTQFFFKHIQNGGSSNVFNKDGSLNAGREVLPVPAGVPQNVFLRGGNLGPLEPVFVSQPVDQYLQTLFIGTSYRSGMINPGVTVFYDWGGALLYQPALTLSRDPFRFTIDYSILDAHTYKGGSGVSLLKDRDNVQFRFEYVL